MVLCDNALRRVRLERQRFCPPANEADYDRLFRDMSPVRTPYWCCPGSPPELSFRAAFAPDGGAARNFDRRSRRELVKGRFQGGGIAYVDEADLALYGAIYRKDAALRPDDARLLDLLRREGPMTVAALREFTGLAAKAITPMLHRLQEMFLVFEDQADSEWDRAWYPFETKFPSLAWPEREDAIERALLRFVRLHGAADETMARSFFGLPLRDLRAALSALTARGSLLPAAREDGSPVFMLPEDVSLLTEPGDAPPRGVFALHRNDFLVKSFEAVLTPIFKKDGQEPLFYLLIDGAFQGAVIGRFRNGPYDLDDIVLTLPPEEAESRREEILAAVALVNGGRVPARYTGK